LDSPVDYHAVFERSERGRALAIISKAEREGLNVVETLVNHFVSKTLIEELTGKEVLVDRKAQRRDINKELPEWARVNATLELTVPEIQSMMKVSNSVALKLVKNTDYFSKVKRGLYLVKDGLAEREAAKSKRDS